MGKKYSFEDFCEIIDKLLGENGCPWDRAQTHESLRPCLIEECYEVVDAIDQKDMNSLKEELGDVLLQVVIHSKMSEKESAGFTLEDVIDGISRKMINRHRHVSFPIAEQPATASEHTTMNSEPVVAGASDDVAVPITTPEEVLRSWDNIKKEEKGNPTAGESMRAVPKSLPALMRAAKVYKYVEKGHPATPEQIAENIRLELDRLLKMVSSNASQESMAVPVGNLALNLAIFSRILQINPEFALTNVIEKFITTFEHIEGLIGGDTAFLEIYASFFQE